MRLLNVSAKLKNFLERNKNVCENEKKFLKIVAVNEKICIFAV